jgi:hypothetical protein
MSLYRTFKTDATKEQKGFAVTFPANEDGTIPTIWISRMSQSNQRYAAAMERKTRPHRKEIEMKLLSEETASRLYREVFCETIITGWANVFDAEGNALEFNFDNAIRLTEELPELYAYLQREAGDLSNYRLATQEDAAKN